MNVQVRRLFLQTEKIYEILFEVPVEYRPFAFTVKPVRVNVKMDALLGQQFCQLQITAVIHALTFEAECPD